MGGGCLTGAMDKKTGLPHSICQSKSKARLAQEYPPRRTARGWRALLMGVLISLTLGFSCWLMLSGGENGKRAGYVLGSTLAGMCCIALVVCRK